MNYAVFWIIPGIFILIFVLFGPLSRSNPNESLGTFLERRLLAYVRNNERYFS